MKKGVATVAQLDEFDEIVDVRSPAEFAEDHIPGSINCPVLDNEQRAQIGTLYKQVSPFEARKLGGALVAENLARHLLARFQDKPRDWRPLVACWRGGQRSGAFTSWLRMIGWDACQLEGGYKNYRRFAVEQIALIAARLDIRIICGATGSAKTRILEALSVRGAQIIDLEALAVHKGSVLGSLPGRPQPTQKWFESCLWSQLRKLDPARPVYLEAESKKIGRLQVPDPLIAAMREAECITIEASREARIAFLLRDYAYLGDDIADLQYKIGCLKSLQSNETLTRWQELAAERALEPLFAEFIDQHYDPLYRRSQNRNYVRFGEATVFESTDLSPDGLDRLAAAILKGRQSS